MDRGGVLDLLAAAPHPGQRCAELGADGIAAADGDRVAAAGQDACPPRSSPPWPPRPSSFPAPPRSPASSPASPASCATSTPNATELGRRTRGSPGGPPSSEVLTSMPGLGVRTAIKICSPSSATASAFPTAAHLAAYAGLAPVTRRSGSSHQAARTRSQRGNHALKSRAVPLRVRQRSPTRVSRAYYDRKSAERQDATTPPCICLARRRLDVIYAMLRDNTTYQPPATHSRRELTKANTRTFINAFTFDQHRIKALSGHKHRLTQPAANSAQQRTHKHRGDSDSATLEDPHRTGPHQQRKAERSPTRPPQARP